jgi:Uma2 family endonuclease
MNAVIDVPIRHRVTVAEFLQMGAAQVFGAETRLELIEGEIVEMAPIGPPHAGTVNALNQAFAARAEERYIVAAQKPVALGARSLPRLDLALLKYREDAYRTSHPTPEDVLLLVEVADTTIDFDLGEKARLYAHAGIRELRVVDLQRRAVHVCREAGEQGYGSVTLLVAPDVLRPVGVPNFELAAALVFPEQGEGAGEGE